MKEAGAAGLKEARSSLLARGGAAIAASPEGQQAIRDTLIERAQVKAQSVFTSVPLPVWLGLGAVAFLYLRRRR